MAPKGKGKGRCMWCELRRGPVCVAADVETQDPDDMMMLALMSTHPGLTLRAVTVNPGAPCLQRCLFEGAQWLAL